MRHSEPTIVWLRNDLRMHDNEALVYAAERGAVLPLYVFSDEGENADHLRLGAASKWWLHHSLAQLSQQFAAAGVPLIIRRGDPERAIFETAKSSGARQVVWNRRYQPAAIKLDTAIKENLSKNGLAAHSLKGNVLHEPWMVSNSSGNPYQVYTPFWLAVSKLAVPPALAIPDEFTPNKFASNKFASNKFTEQKLTALTTPAQTDTLQSLRLLPKVNWADQFSKYWSPGEQGARSNLESFLSQGLSNYKAARDFAACEGTSRLSPHLHFGELSIREVWHHIKQFGGIEDINTETYLKQLVWRDFAHHLLFHFPDLPTQPLRKKFEKFPWNNSPSSLVAWQRGVTGYPMVDAGMRELWATGWMHNRVRMIVGSFLVKHLRIHWLEGAKWFWETLVDADLANNTMGWQWIAGCGPDAAPYFRVFNPMLQGEKFDAEGDYVRNWIPELRNLPNKFIHRPWQAPSNLLNDAGVVLGKNYPYPIVDHDEARDEALCAYATLKT